MLDLEEMSKEELITLIKAMNSEEDNKQYHPDSMMAMAMASPKEARAISWRMMHPLAKFTLFGIISLFIMLFLAFIFIVVLG